MLIHLFVPLLALNCVFGTPTMIHGPEEIDNFIFDLDFDPRNFLTRDFISKDKAVTESDLDELGNFVVLDRSIESIAIYRDEVGIPTVSKSHIFPGAILKANSHLTQGDPDVLAFDRKPLVYTLDLPEMDHGFKIKPSFSKYAEKLDTSVTQWLEKNKKSRINFQKQNEYIYSKEQLRAVFGGEIEDSDLEEDIDFEGIKSGDTVLVSRLKCMFFSASVEQPSSASELFGPETTIKLLKQKVDKNNPPVMVEQVFYGRVIYIVTTSRSLDQHTRKALTERMESFNLEDSNDFGFLKDYNIRIYVMGSGNDYIESYELENMSDATKVISKYGTFRPNNFGYPISYSIRDLRGRRVTIRNLATFVKTTRIVYPPGLIHLVHVGAYVAYFNVSWDAVKYDKDGKLLREHKVWEHSYQSKTARFEEEISLAGNCRNISVSAAENNAFQWSLIFSFNGIKLVDRRTFKIGGATLNAWVEIDPVLD